MVARGQVGSLDDQLATYCQDFSMMTEYNITLKQLAAQVSHYSYQIPMHTHPPDEREHLSTVCTMY